MIYCTGQLVKARTLLLAYINPFINAQGKKYSILKPSYSSIDVGGRISRQRL